MRLKLLHDHTVLFFVICWHSSPQQSIKVELFSAVQNIMNWLISVFSPLILNGSLLDKLYQNNWNPPLLRVDLKILVIPHQLHEFTHHHEFLYFLGQDLRLQLATLLGFLGRAIWIWIWEGHNFLYPKVKTTCMIQPIIFSITILGCVHLYFIFIPLSREKTKRNCNLKFSSFSFLISIYLYPPLHTKNKEIH